MVMSYSPNRIVLMRRPCVCEEEALLRGPGVDGTGEAEWPDGEGANGKAVEMLCMCAERRGREEGPGVK